MARLDGIPMRWGPGQVSSEALWSNGDLDYPSLPFKNNYFYGNIIHTEKDSSLLGIQLYEF